MSKIKNGGLDQYGAEPFKQQQFGTASAEVVNKSATPSHSIVVQIPSASFLHHGALVAKQYNWVLGKAWR